MVAKFAITWNKSVAQGVKIMRAWQEWLEDLPPSITCTLHLTKGKGGLMTLHVAGLSVASETRLRVELKRLQTLAGPAEILSTSTMTFDKAANIFNGGGPATAFMKGKSAYLTDPMSDQGILTLLDGLQKSPVAIVALCDSYGGAINKVASGATAFVHRGNTRYSIQYVKEWPGAGASAANIAAMRTLYDAMRPFVSGGCYVNYCDLDLGDGYAKAYWGDNLPRLMKVKAQFDPNNVFRHAQSVPLG